MWDLCKKVLLCGSLPIPLVRVGHKTFSLVGVFPARELSMVGENLRTESSCRLTAKKFDCKQIHIFTGKPFQLKILFGLISVRLPGVGKWDPKKQCPSLLLKKNQIIIPLPFLRKKHGQHFKEWLPFLSVLSQKLDKCFLLQYGKGHQPVSGPCWTDTRNKLLAASPAKASLPYLREGMAFLRSEYELQKNNSTRYGFFKGFKSLKFKGIFSVWFILISRIEKIIL